MARAVLIFAAWRGMASGSELISTLAQLAFFGLLPSFWQVLGRAKRVEPVLHEGDTTIVLQEATWRDWVRVKRVLHEDFNIDYTTARSMFAQLPVLLEPAVVRWQADDVVAKLTRAGAVASAVTIDQEVAPA